MTTDPPPTTGRGEQNALLVIVVVTAFALGFIVASELWMIGVLG